MARHWKPHYKVLCGKCGWTGSRATVSKPCPKCGHWYPAKQARAALKGAE